MENTDILIALLLSAFVLLPIFAFFGEDIFDFFYDFFDDKHIKRVVRAAKKGNMIPLAKRIVKNQGNYGTFYGICHDWFTEKERTEIMNICFNLIRLKKFPKNPQEKEDRIKKLKTKFQVNDWEPEYDMVKEANEMINAAKAKKAKAKKIN